MKTWIIKNIFSVSFDGVYIILKAGRNTSVTEIYSR
jgi:hypothetical protein